MYAYRYRYDPYRRIGVGQGEGFQLAPGPAPAPSIIVQTPSPSSIGPMPLSPSFSVTAPAPTPSFNPLPVSPAPSFNFTPQPPPYGSIQLGPSIPLFPPRYTFPINPNFLPQPAVVNDYQRGLDCGKRAAKAAMQALESCRASVYDVSFSQDFISGFCHELTTLVGSIPFPPNLICGTYNGNNVTQQMGSRCGTAVVSAVLNEWRKCAGNSEYTSSECLNAPGNTSPLSCDFVTGFNDGISSPISNYDVRYRKNRDMNFWSYWK